MPPDSPADQVPALPAEAAVPCALPPVIILGMHRSGTSMVAELLDQLGLFVGRRLQDDHESTFFLDLNEKVLSRIGAAWDQPAPVLDFLACEPAVQMTALALRADLMSRRAGRFFAAGPRVGAASFEQFDRPWGWKDPRTLFTLPLWLRLFPEARLVYIVRHGVDVASSLVVRERRLLQRRLERFESRLRKLSLRPALERAGYKGSPRCLTLDGAFSLWDQYVQQGEAVLRNLPNPLHTIRYEDFLADPARHLHDLARFCGLKKADDAIVQRAATRVNAGRAKAFAADAELADFYQRVKANRWMRQFQY